MRTTPNELRFGCKLRLLEELAAPLRPTRFNYGIQAKRLAKQIWTLRAHPPKDQRSSGLNPAPLCTSTHGFTRVDSVWPDFHSSGSNSFGVIKRSPKLFILDVVSRRDMICTERVKLATVGNGLIYELIPSHESCHPSGFQPLPTSLAEVPCGATHFTKPIRVAEQSFS